MRRACLLTCLVLSVYCRTFENRCKLAYELVRVGMPRDTFLGQWVCLIENVSKRDTSAITVTPSGRKFYGLYQIPSKWCRMGKKGGECNIACESLLNDDIRDDTACALTIFHQEGFKYWTKWDVRCKNNNFIASEVYQCPDLFKISPERGTPINRNMGRYRRKRRSIRRWKQNQ